MAVRSNRLWATGNLTGGGPHALVTCPADRTIIVKDLTVQNVSAATQAVSITLRTPSAALNVWRGDVASGVTAVDRDRFVVLEPGDSLELGGPAAGSSVRTAGFGSMLAGAPE